MLAISGQTVSGGPQLQGVSFATLNDAGDAALLATLQHGVGGVGENNDRAVLIARDSTRNILAQAGAGAVGGGVYDQFSTASIDNSGDVVVRGGISGGGTRIWRLHSVGEGSVIAATGIVGVPGLPLDKLDFILPDVFHTSAGNVAYNGMLRPEGLVTFNNDRGVWLDSAGTGTLLIREGVSQAPGLGFATFQLPIAQAVNNQSQTAIFGTLFVQGEVTAIGATGVWRIGPTSGELIARRGSGNVGSAPGASYAQFAGITINAAGEVAFAAELELGGSITETNRRGLWKFNGTATEALVRSGDAPIGAPSLQFASFGAPLLNDVGSVLFEATLTSGVGGVDANNAEAIWRYDADGGALLARTGVSGVPGIPEASFADFTALAFNENGVAAVGGALVPGTGGVTAANDQGLWLLHSSGGHLIAREGDLLAGRIIESLEFAAGSGGGDGRPRSLNSQNELVFKATFTSGEEGIFLFRADTTPGSTADFTLDGLINADDLLRWKNNFGRSTGASLSQGDADSDGDVDGADFLTWQRQLGVTPPLASIPEPSLPTMLLSAGLIASLILRDVAPRRDSRE